jgi:hypothetical protein
MIEAFACFSGLDANELLLFQSLICEIVLHCLY